MAIQMKRVSVELVLNLTNPSDVRVYEKLKPMLLDPRPGMANLRVGELMLAALQNYIEQKGSQESEGKVGLTSNN